MIPFYKCEVKMLFIRISDYVDIYTFKKPFKFLNNKRKGNIVKKFIIDKTIEDQIKFFEDDLQSKMIPKKSINILKSHPIKTLVLCDGKSISFQDIDCKVRFLIINDAGEIEQVTFDELAVDDSIICYDDEGNEWYLNDIDLTSIVYMSDEYEEKINDEDISDEEDDDFFDDVELSNYIICSDNGGIIINGIMVI